jgi:LPXTG-motif cell wall-anchored protein
MATVKATDLSTFAVTVAGTPSTTTGTTTTTTGTGSLVTSSGTGSTTTTGTGSLVTSSGTGSSSTSQSSVQGGQDTNALDDDDGDGVATLANASTPLASSSAFETDDTAGTSQSGGIDQGASAALVASIAVVLAAALWFFLRRRRKLATLAEMEYCDEPRTPQMETAVGAANSSMLVG